MEEIWPRTKLLLVNLAQSKKRGRIKRYSLPFILILTALITISILSKNYLEFIQAQTLATLLLVLIVTVISWYGGLGPGILATILTTFFNYFLLLNQDLSTHPLAGDFIVSGIYLFLGVSISIINEARYESEQQKDEFIAITAHELKNPLTSIRGFAELIYRSSLKTKSYNKLIDYAKNIQIESEKLLELINDLLDVTKIEVGKFAYKTEPFEFYDLVKETILHQQVIYKDRQIVLSGKTKKVITGDRYRIGQVIANLLTNALKYSPENKKVNVKIKDSKKSVILEVRDYGAGILTSDQKKIFKGFYRTNQASQSKTEGLGLGLYISNKIVTYHKGIIKLKSRKGYGSKFTLVLDI